MQFPNRCTVVMIHSFSCDKPLFLAVDPCFFSGWPSIFLHFCNVLHTFHQLQSFSQARMGYSITSIKSFIACIALKHLFLCFCLTSLYKNRMISTTFMTVFKIITIHLLVYFNKIIDHQRYAFFLIRAWFVRNVKK